MDEKFASVKYSEFKPDYDSQEAITAHVSGKPWLLISVGTSGSVDLSLSVEAGGGLTVELIEPLLKKTLLAISQANDTTN